MKPIGERETKVLTGGFCTEHPSVPGPLRRDVEKVARRGPDERTARILKARGLSKP